MFGEDVCSASGCCCAAAIALSLCEKARQELGAYLNGQTQHIWRHIVALIT